MCGICGKIYLDTTRRIEHAEVAVMRDNMVSRGPDAAGIHLDRNAGLGHRRLSIIDLEASAQPMSNEDGTVWIVYNGEVYNFVELRHELLARGHRFRTAGDTEVIVHLYEEFGQECVNRLRGMFTFAIWDSRSDTLFLARDRIGIKPLYYALDDQAFLFGSELKALLEDEHFRANREIDPDAVHSFLSFLCVPDPVCIYSGVRKLPAGHTLTLKGGRVELRRYWDVTFKEEDGLTEEEWGEQLLEIMREAIRIRLVADVPLGAFLSGGIDSSTVVALMTGLMDRPVKTFSIGFSEHSYNEASDARLVARHLGTDHTELILKPADARFLIPRLLEHFDEPFADASAIPTYYVSKLAREQVTVVLSGDGGDELFGGYPWRQVRPQYQLLLSRLPFSVRSGIRKMSAILPPGAPGVNFLRRIDIPYSRYILDAMAVFDDEDRCGLYAPLMSKAVKDFDPYRHHLLHLERSNGRSWEERMMEYDLKTYLPNDILTKVDRMSMRTSLEARVPLLDHHLVELAARIPARFKIRQGVAKYILKKVIAPYLPREVLEKRKQGFSVPIETWLRTELKEDVLDTLRGGNRHGFFDRQAVERLTDAFYRGDDSRNYQVWALYAFELWHRNVHCGNRKTTFEVAKMPTVTVVVPAVNAGRYIGEALDSIKKQTLRDLEVLIVDDGSTDGTVRKAESFKGSIDLTILRQANAGPAAARNAGIRRANSRLCAFLDADDIMLPERLAAQAELLDNDPDLGLVHTDLMTFNERGIIHRTRRAFSEPCGGMVLDRLLMDNFITTSTVMAPKKRLLEAGLFSEERRVSEDFELWLRMATRWKVGFIDRALVRYRSRPGSLSSNKLATGISALEVIEAYWQENPEYGKKHPQIRRRSQAQHLATAGAAAFAQRRRGIAFTYLIRALRHCPWQRHSWRWLAKTMILWPPIPVEKRTNSNEETA